MIAVLPAAAQEPVETGADIGAGSGAPIILCKWELPDDDRDATNGMQYDNDDIPEATAGFPCWGVGNGIGYVEGAQGVIQVMANPEDDPTERLIELWTAVKGSANAGAVDSVYWDIFHPDGSLKVQTYGGPFEGSPSHDLGAEFDTGSGQYVVYPGGMWAAATDMFEIPGTGQIDPDTVTNQVGLIGMAAQNGLQLWNGAFELSKHQPCGAYRVENFATYAGATTMMTNFLDVLCFVNLETDFTSVQWGDITPGGTDWVYGNLTFGDGEYPTVKNTGSGGMMLGIEFSHMARPEDPSGWEFTDKRIEWFDAMFGINPDYLSGFDLPAYEPRDFGNGYNEILCANETGKLDLSIHPYLGLPAGHYEGYLQLWGMHNPDSPCHNDHGDWIPPFVRG